MLKTKDVSFNEHIYDFIPEQNGKYIINETTFICHNFNVDFAERENSQGRLDWRPSVVNNTGKIGIYVNVFRSKLLKGKVIS